MAANDLHLLRPAIEAAMAVARQGEAQDPPVPAPAVLRPFLSFARLPPAALAVARRVVDEDEDFRARVRAAIGHSDVGPMGRLWLERPEGWAEALAEAARATSVAAGGSADADGAGEPRRTRRRSEEAAAARAESRLRQAVEEQERLRQEVSELRRANRRLGTELERTESQVVALTEDRTAAVRQLKAVEASLAERVAESRRHRDDAEAARRQLAEAQAALARAESTPPIPAPAAAAAAGAPGDAGGAEGGGGRGGAGRVDPDAPGGGLASLDLPRAARTVAEAAEAAARLAGALADLAQLTGTLMPEGSASASPSETAPPTVGPPPGAVRATSPPGRAPRSEEDAAPLDVVAAAEAAATVADLASPSGQSTTEDPAAVADLAFDAVERPAQESTPAADRRRRVRLARGALDDTPAGAEDLARLPDVVFLVDGYNVSMTGWPDLDLVAQRLRLVNAVAELRARFGTQVEVVFDGNAEGRSLTRALPAAVRVWFTAQGVEADDLILSLVDRQPPHRPVVVVSSDRRVLQGAAERGASVLSSPTFLGLLR